MSNFKNNRLNISIIIYSCIFAMVISRTLFFLFSSKFSFVNFIHIILVFMILFNSWNIQLMHINRYGRDSLVNLTFVWLQIVPLAAFLVYRPFKLKFLLGLLTILAVLLAIQHIIEYFSTKNEDLMIKKLTEPFCYILIGRAAALALGFVFVKWAFWFIFLALLISQLLPSFISRSLHVKDINFSHLVANTHIMIILSAITILIGNFIYFGFSIKTLLLDLIIMALLYFFNKKILFVDIEINKQSGNDFILGTYFIIFGFYLVNFSLGYSHIILYFIFAVIALVIGHKKYKLYKIED